MLLEIIMADSMQWAKKQTGFTIVELLIVVVVIAILAALITVAYNGITKRAKEATAQNSAQSVTQKLMTYSIDNGEVLPADLASVGIADSNGITYQYSVNNTTSPAGYCVTVIANGVAEYVGSNYTYTSGASTATVNQSNPANGVCPGHAGAGATATTNLSTNPGVELNVSGYGGPNGATVMRDTTRAYQGAASLRTTMPAATSGTVGVSLYQINSLGGSGQLQPNKTYTFSAYVYAPSGTPDPYLTVQGSGRASKVDPTGYSTTLKDQWVRLYNTFDTGASGVITLYVLNKNTTTANQQYWVDNVMISEGVTTPYAYADGNSTGWVWNGPQYSSTSNGPAS